MQNILFRADSSSTIGTGHIMRDLVLAEQFKGDNITFATQDFPANINQKIEEKEYAIEILSSNTVEELDILIKKLKIDMIVIDHYGIDYNFEKQLKESNPSLIIMVLDDTYERHYCDILLNHNIYAESTRYKDLVPANCELRCGSQYTLLREEFKAEKQQQKSTSYNDINIFIAMGGADHSNLNTKILDVLENIPNVHANVVTTTANQHLPELQVYVKNKSNITLHINTNDIAKLMHQASLAIVTPSVTVNEVVYMNIPFIAIQTASNQAYMTKYLISNEYRVMEVFEKGIFYKLLSSTPSFNIRQNLRSLFIITGTTKGLGKELFNTLKSHNTVLTINRKEVIYSATNLHNLNLDLSHIDLDKIKIFNHTLNSLLTKNISKIVFINNAFSMGTLAKIDTLEDYEVINSFNTNIISSYLLIKNFIHLTKELTIDKRILNISSGAARTPIDGWSTYCMSKSSIEMFIHNIKVEYDDYECFNIDPGVINTEMQSKIRAFEEGDSHQYFVELYQTNQLKEPSQIAHEIIKEYT